MTPLEGASVGALEGGIIGLLAGLGALALPGVGPILAAGPLVGALTGAVTGAATGGLLTALVEAGIPPSEVEAYRDGVARGTVLLSVHTDERNAPLVREIVDRHSQWLDEHRELWEDNPDYDYGVTVDRVTDSA